MKKSIITLSVLLSAAFGLQSCSKGEYNSGDKQTGFNPFNADNNKPKQKKVGKMTAVIDGADFTAAYANAYFSDFGSIYFVGFKTASMAGDVKDGITIYCYKADVGYYDFSDDPSEKVYATYAPQTGQTPYRSSTGILQIISKNDTMIKGAFEFEGEGKIIKNGSFELPIVK